MAVDLSAGSDLANQLAGVVRPKLVEVGWSADLNDNTLTEYIILMLANGKSQQEIASELAVDLLALEENDQSAVDFTRWLFEQAEELKNQALAPAAAPVHENAQEEVQDAAMEQAPQVQDAEMDDAADASSKSIPTGPKAMRSGNARGGNRMFNQMNKAMDRSSDPLHRVQNGTGRINSHSNRGNSRGNKGSQIQRNFEGANRRAMQNNSQAPQFPMVPTMPMGAMGTDQTSQMLQMFQEHAKMMADLAAQHGFVNPNFGQQENSRGGGRGRGYDRNNKRGRGDRNRQSNRPAKDGDTAMGDDVTEGSESKDPAQTVCKFNLYCTKVDCPFAHQSPVAPAGTPIDVSSECTYGAACKNHKCASRHPSPAKKFEHQQQQECKFGPYCTNTSCPFKHSTSTPCRNGGDCADEGCTFFHSPIECRFNPCTNVRCQFKHKEGQKAGAAGAPGGNVWKPAGAHVSERKFTADDGQVEEVIIPGAAQKVEQEAMAT